MTYFFSIRQLGWRVTLLLTAVLTFHFGVLLLMALSPLVFGTSWDVFPGVLCALFAATSATAVLFALWCANAFMLAALAPLSALLAVLCTIAIYTAPRGHPLGWDMPFCVAVAWASVPPIVALFLTLRGRWGWRAYDAVGAARESQRLFARYEQLLALLLLDVSGAALALSAGELALVLPLPSRLAMALALAFGAASALVLAFFVPLEASRVCGAAVLFLSAAQCGTAFGAAANTLAFVRGTANAKARRGGISAAGAVEMALAADWAAVLARAAVIARAVQLLAVMDGRLRHALHAQRAARQTARAKAPEDTGKRTAICAATVQVYNASTRLLLQSESNASLYATQSDTAGHIN